MYHLFIIAQVSPPSEIHEGIKQPEKEKKDSQRDLRLESEPVKGTTAPLLIRKTPRRPKPEPSL
jgi:hypothetical protein